MTPPACTRRQGNASGHNRIPLTERMTRGQGAQAGTIGTKPIPRHHEKGPPQYRSTRRACLATIEKQWLQRRRLEAAVNRRIGLSRLRHNPEDAPAQVCPGPCTTFRSEKRFPGEILRTTPLAPVSRLHGPHTSAWLTAGISLAAGAWPPCHPVAREPAAGPDSASVAKLRAGSAAGWACRAKKAIRSCPEVRPAGATTRNWPGRYRLSALACSS